MSNNEQDEAALSAGRSSKIDPEVALSRFRDGAKTEEEANRRLIVRAAFVAAKTDRRCREAEGLDTRHSAELHFDDFKAFATSVWQAEGRTEPLYVSLISSLPSHTQALLQDLDGAARWAIPPADDMGIPRQGELTGTTGPVAYIDVTEDGCNRLVALHEIAHLLSDDLTHHEGHSEKWAAVYGRLQLHHLCWDVAALWALEWSWWLAKSVEHLDADPDWIKELAPPPE